jgi:hypothetical protein
MPLRPVALSDDTVETHKPFTLDSAIKMISFFRNLIFFPHALI